MLTNLATRCDISDPGCANHNHFHHTTEVAAPARKRAAIAKTNGSVQASTRASRATSRGEKGLA